MSWPDHAFELDRSDLSESDPTRTALAYDTGAFVPPRGNISQVTAGTASVWPDFGPFLAICPSPRPNWPTRGPFALRLGAKLVDTSTRWNRRTGSVAIGQ